MILIFFIGLMFIGLGVAVKQNPELIGQAADSLLSEKQKAKLNLENHTNLVFCVIEMLGVIFIVSAILVWIYLL